MRRLLFVAGSALALCAGAAGVLHAQSQTAAAEAARPVDAAERRQVVTGLAEALESSFVFPEVGTRYAAMLRGNLASGAYDGLTDPLAFAGKVTADLQAVHPDGHLGLSVRGVSAPPRRPAQGAVAASTRASGPPGLEETRMIGDVAYLRFNEFPGEPDQIQAARRFLLENASARAVIIDARPHRGGGIAEMDALLPLFYGQRTVLVRMDTRASVDADGPLRDGPTLVRRPSGPGVVSRDHIVRPDAAETRLRKVPIFYLTSSRTASAAEHLALAFKRTGRATLVGETTRGAGHFGAGHSFGRFQAFVPVGRTYDPQTGEDWEGRGVAPDVAVPADGALDEALRLAKAAGA